MRIVKEEDRLRTMLTLTRMTLERDYILHVVEIWCLDSDLSSVLLRINDLDAGMISG
jgi:hypothetical protein